MDQKDAITSLHKNLGIGKRAVRPTPAAKRHEIQAGQVQALGSVLADIRRRARETPAWANAYNSAATAVELEIAAVSKGAVRAAAPVSRPTDDELWDKTLRDRDTYHEWADKLAEGIAKYFGIEIGEHSNQNLPWAEALEHIEAISAAPVSGQGATLPPLPDPILFGHFSAAQASAYGQLCIDSRPRSEDSRAKVLREVEQLFDATSCFAISEHSVQCRIRALASSAAPTGGVVRPTEKVGGLSEGDKEKVRYCARMIRAIAELGHDKPLGDWVIQALSVSYTLADVVGEELEDIIGYDPADSAQTGGA